MKNIEEGSTKHLILEIVITSIVGMILFPVYDFLLCKFIMKTGFVYTISNYIVEPIFFGIIMGSVLWTTEKSKDEEKK